MRARKPIVLGMSGGVDSFVSAILLKESGYEVIGLHLDHCYTEEGERNSQVLQGDQLQTSSSSLDLLCKQLDIRLYKIDRREEFESVIHYFTSTYITGGTPNPCVYCNAHFKFVQLVQFANQLGVEKIATGHYVDCKKEEGRFFLRRAKHDWKDQSYMLWALPQEILSRCVFPLAHLTKEEVKAKAIKEGFPQIAEKAESYGICFIPDRDYSNFLRQRCPELDIQVSDGLILDKDHLVRGKHEGYPFYTLGQSIRLGNGGEEKLYISAIDVKRNTLQVDSKQALLKKEIRIEGIRYQKYPSLNATLLLWVRIRGKDIGREAVVTFEGERASLHFQDAVFAPAIGQSAVCYQGNDLVCGGVIC